MQEDGHLTGVPQPMTAIAGNLPTPHEPATGLPGIRSPFNPVSQTSGTFEPASNLLVSKRDDRRPSTAIPLAQLTELLLNKN